MTQKLYDVNLKNVRKSYTLPLTGFIIGIIMLIPIVVLIILFAGEGSEIFLALILPGAFIIAGSKGTYDAWKHIHMVKKLSYTGKLIKNVPYFLVPADVNDSQGNEISSPVAKIVLNGKTLNLKGDPRFDHKESDKDQLVDILIDEENPQNYFIDFEINRISGNLPEDYYDKKSAEKTRKPVFKWTEKKI